MSRDKNSDQGVWKLITQLEQKKDDSDMNASDKDASQRLIGDTKGLSPSGDKSETDKETASGKRSIPAYIDNNSTNDRATFGMTDKRSIEDVSGGKKVICLQSDKSSLPPTSVVDKLPTINITQTKPILNTDNDTMSIIDKGTTSDKEISDENVGSLSARELSINDKELNSVSDKEISKLNIELIAPGVKQELIMIDGVIRTRPVNNPVTIMLHQINSSASQINGNRLVIRKAAATNADRENNANDDATALKLLSKDDARDKPMRTDASRDKNYLTSVKARRPDFLTLSPVSPSDTDEDRTPRPLSGSFRNSDSTPLSAFSFIELPLRFRQHLDDNNKLSVPNTPYPDTVGTLKYQDELGMESRDVNDDTIVALDWIQQELRQLKCTNRGLVRDLLGIGASIHQLRGLTDCQSFNPDEQSTETGEERSPDWTIPVHPSASADLCILLDGHLTSPLTVKKKRRMRLEEGMTGRRSLDTVTMTSPRHSDQNEFYV